MMKKDLFIAINLQLFSKREKENRMELLTDPKKNTLVPISSDRNNKKKKNRTFTREELAKILTAEIKKAEVDWEKKRNDQQEKIEKAKEVAIQKEFQKQLAQKEAEIAELQRKQLLAEASKMAYRMFNENNLLIDEDLLHLVIQEDLETTKKAVNIIISFVSKLERKHL
ncbi:hypothetical protein MEPL4_5c00840 [Melissococcus plutonius]|uniref:Uncharacterized protein n=3 Tax=Melissococcus plutonius TaxID=33970 RepID=F3YBN5_MELPT|nr:hypothetical protein MEPL_c013620 [Melissococcus plutonius S1]KMT23881.1 hypothetical protein MEPL2_3c00840 [Melissococcus plutonius]BAK21913.1 hypothetical protein MPTP_1484 [Melissococcus plutonius ATCC 35311]BAL61808.1 hypothetical protein MPD5_0539 [Melissococcus plutonius DAT561]KMT24404.1 hypothetical protein MEPL3_6c00840 [Melissococcus plutonius]